MDHELIDSQDELSQEWIDGATAAKHGFVVPPGMATMVLLIAAVIVAIKLL